MNLQNRQLQSHFNASSKSQFETLENALLVRAPAKINLSLLIADKRADGFHNLETIMSKITFYDELIFEPTDKQGIELVCKGPNWAPAGRENLIYKACQLFFNELNQPPKVKATLIKNIPAASGLGGASSDAASTLLALNKLTQKPLSKQKLHSLAAELGSDVPFFLAGPLAFCSGRGEKIAEIKKNFHFNALLILPGVTVSTKRVYEQHKVDMTLFKSLNTQINHFIEQNRLDLITKMCANMLAKASFKDNIRLTEIKTFVDRICCAPACLSGSGSSLFRVFDDCDYAKYQVCRLEIEKVPKCKSIIVFDNQW